MLKLIRNSNYKNIKVLYYYNMCLPTMIVPLFYLTLFLRNNHIVEHILLYFLSLSFSAKVWYCYADNTLPCAETWINVYITCDSWLYDNIFDIVIFYMWKYVKHVTRQEIGLIDFTIIFSTSSPDPWKWWRDHPVTR